MDTDSANPFIDGPTDQQQATIDAMRYRHPQTVVAHLLFRTLAILSYVFCTVISASFVINFVLLIVLCACDFWTVKNVSGRLLVGLRWRNFVKEDGSNEWVFESKKVRLRSKLGNSQSYLLSGCTFVLFLSFLLLLLHN